MIVSLNTVAQVPHNFTNGQPANANQINENFTFLNDRINNAVSVTQTAHGFTVGTPIISIGNNIYEAAIADSETNAECVGIVSKVNDSDSFIYLTSGKIKLATTEWDLKTGETGGLSANVYYLSRLSAGSLTSAQATAEGQINKPLIAKINETDAILINQITSKFTKLITLSNDDPYPANQNASPGISEEVSRKDHIHKSVERFPRDLVVENNATNPTFQVDVRIPSESVSVTLDIVSDLDTGSEAADTWYYIWSFRNSYNELTFRLSASVSAPTEPSGYAKERLLGAIRNDASGNFKTVYQRGHHVAVVQQAAFQGKPNRSPPTAIDLSAFIPENAVVISGWVSAWETSGIPVLNISSMPVPTGSTAIVLNGTSNHALSVHYRAVILETQTIYLDSGPSSARATFCVTMWEY